MKTSLTCLGILIAALVLGNFQGSRLELKSGEFFGSRLAGMKAETGLKLGEF